MVRPRWRVSPPFATHDFPLATKWSYPSRYVLFPLVSVYFPPTRPPSFPPPSTPLPFDVWPTLSFSVQSLPSPSHLIPKHQPTKLSCPRPPSSIEYKLKHPFIKQAPLACVCERLLAYFVSSTLSIYTAEVLWTTRRILLQVKPLECARPSTALAGSPYKFITDLSSTIPLSWILSHSVLRDISRSCRTAAAPAPLHMKA
ncbi:hypothetical protein BV22DRAFT_916882 [Leucogyrophana mollusca]|uniref:Uncharacterized protein n=1 Tax=Leucogyrophana mollusca TaxID=85980 RepID=A0ACB8AY76_9AGAM|nr:hypothetical protein BV22DRAFT_916882 [Leucogyrophana mollusca]